MEIIPAIDIIGGHCVRLSKGDYGTSKTYCTSPLDMAKEFEDAGFARLHLVDLDGAKASGVVNLGVLESIASGTRLKVDFGGGIKSDRDIAGAFDAGASLVCVGSVAQKNPELTRTWFSRYGRERIIVCADILDGKVCTGGWATVTDTTLHDLIGLYGGQIEHLLCTDISRDGMLCGSPVELYSMIRTRYPAIHLIASGGVASMFDLVQMGETGVQSAIVGKAIYEKKIDLAELAAFNTNKL